MTRFANIWSETNMSNFHPLEVVGRCSKTQLQVGEYLNTITSTANLNKFKVIYYLLYGMNNYVLI